jgi:ATP-dependent DNA helicase DinG
MDKDILQYWPMAKSLPRESQEKVLKWIEALPIEKKYILCEIPVGGGKSPIGLNLSAYLADSKGSSFILTPQKILQKQYQDSFDKSQLLSLYGKANYTCAPKETNCDIGSDIKPKCESCPHRDAMGAARYAPNIVLNYTLAMLLFMLSTELKIGKRKLMVLDECHTLEHHLTEFQALQIGEKRCRQFKVKWTKPNSEYEAIDWIKETYKPAVIHEHSQLTSIVQEITARYEDNEHMDKADAEIINKLKDVTRHLDVLNEYCLLGVDDLIQKYALIIDKSYFKFKPLYGREIFNKFMKPMADRFLFMSSTILDKDAFCHDLGIPPEEAAFISIDSEFPLDNRPVLYSPTMKMTYGWDKDDKKSDRKIMINKIIDICKLHEGDSGIIHTGSFQLANWLIRELTGKVSQRIMHHAPDSDYSRDVIIDDFTDNNNDIPSLLISPSITEGLDLKDDRARFSITAKVPFPNISDAWTKRRMELSKEWYNRQAMLGIIQGAGRVIRSKEDWGYNYILDESFGALYQRYIKNTPAWFKNSIIRE